MGQSIHASIQEMHLQVKMLRDIYIVKLYNRLADIAADLPSRYFEFASKERNQENSREDFSHSEDLITSSCWSYKILRLNRKTKHYKDTWKLYFPVVNYWSFKIAQEQGRLWRYACKWNRVCQVYEALQVVVDIAAKLVPRCFDVFPTRREWRKLLPVEEYMKILLLIMV